MNTRYLLAALLASAILTIWVGERWAVSGVEIGAYITACAIVLTRGRLPAGIALLAPALMCGWAATQWTAGWSAAPSATIDSWLYWLAATCFVLIGSYVDKDAFLTIALAIGAVVCVAGTIQLFTSRGDIFWLFPSGFDRRVIGPFVSPNNYAAFVELLIPLALMKRTSGYLLLAAALAASVAASGSRTGAVLALLEMATVLILQRRNRRAVLVLASATVALSLIAGQQFLAARFAQTYDPFALRREFLQSSLAMFRAQPLHGFGLGTWPVVYPQYALLDVGAVVNHAHNEWAQWAAEGGIPAFVLMLGLLLWTVRPALRSIWGIGILAIFAHSLVDYPFFRIGLAAWVFAFLGVLSQNGKPGRHLPVTAVAPILLFGVWKAGRLAYADFLYRGATPASVERAANIAPDRADYHFALAQLDPAHAATHLERALAVNPFDSQARIGLALERETVGDRAAAEQELIEATRHDRQFAPAWALASFYFRGGDANRLWMWARKSAAMSYGDRRALFDLCYLETGDTHQVFKKIVESRQDLELPFLNYLILHHRAQDAAEVAERIAVHRTPASREALLDYTDAAIEAGDFAAAWRVWMGFMGGQPLLWNGNLAVPGLNRGFDWRIPGASGIAITRMQAGGPALAIEFLGREPESCELLKHALCLESGARYIMRFDYRTVDLPGRTGVSWKLGNTSGVVLAASPAWTRQEWRFRASNDRELRLTYERAAGNTRAEGRLFLRNVRIDAAPL